MHPIIFIRESKQVSVFDANKPLPPVNFSLLPHSQAQFPFRCSKYAKNAYKVYLIPIYAFIFMSY